MRFAPRFSGQITSAFASSAANTRLLSRFIKLFKNLAAGGDIELNSCFGPPVSKGLGGAARLEKTIKRPAKGTVFVAHNSLFVFLVIQRIRYYKMGVSGLTKFLVCS